MRMKIALLGCGNMGMAYAQSFVKHHIVEKSNLLLFERHAPRREALESMALGEVLGQIDERLNTCNIVILAVKPQDFHVLANEVKSLLAPDVVVLSIMAGLTIDKIATALKTKRIVRAMPNSPAQIGMGITAYTAHSGVLPEQLHKIENLLATTGRTVFIENESGMDAVTALSGSGPAYFFYLVKAMVDAGTRMGLEEPVAAMLVEQTMLGSFHLINNSNLSLDELIQAVASKGGTTEAALSRLKMHQVGEHLAEAILVAEQRAKVLSQML
jgi:pyrroline-5-carboxylate reductase